MTTSIRHPLLVDDRNHFPDQQSQSRSGVPQDLNRTEFFLQDILKTLQDSAIAGKGEKDVRSRTETFLQDILKTLQDSTIAEKGEKDVRSRYWATYSQVAKEHDDEFLERSNSDMDIVLIFSGLFSAVNTAFIIAMQPNSTDMLLSQLVQNTSPNTTTSAPTGQRADSATTIWFQGFAYVALSFSLLAALGAVLGKQWLSHYKSNDIHSSLEDRGPRRQQKLDGLEAWHFHAVMRFFPVLLQISLLLFGIALSAFVWSQQGALAVTVMVSTVFGFLFYTFVVVASLKSPQCPFQTPISALIRWLWSRFKTYYKNRKDAHSPQDDEKPVDDEEPVDNKEPGDEHSVRPSMKWIFETSTDPEVISSVAWLLPTIKQTKDLDMKTVRSRLLSTFKTCFHADVRPSRSARKRALACGRALHHVTCDETIQVLDPSNDISSDSVSELWTNWQNIAFPWGLEDCRQSFIQYNATLEDHYKDEACVALRFAIGTGCPGFLNPSSAALIWDGVFDLNGAQRTPKDFDWLVDFLVHFRRPQAMDVDAMADALLALSAMRKMGSLTRRDRYLGAIIFSMKADKPSRLRHAALRAVFDARFDLVKIADEKEGNFRKQLLTDLTPALLTATTATAPQQSKNHPDALFNPGREYFYLRLIYTLATQKDWRTQLEKTGHIDRCVALLEHVTDSSHLTTGSQNSVRNHYFYVAGALIRMNASGSYRNSDLAKKISESEWWILLKRAWLAMRSNYLYYEEDSEAIEVLPDLVKYTLESLETPPAMYDTGGLLSSVNRIYRALNRVAGSEAAIISALESVRDALYRIRSDGWTQSNSAANDSVPAGIINPRLQVHQRSPR